MAEAAAVALGPIQKTTATTAGSIAVPIGLGNSCASSWRQCGAHVRGRVYRAARCLKGKKFLMLFRPKVSIR
jgi:hypothetical protein